MALDRRLVWVIDFENLDTTAPENIIRSRRFINVPKKLNQRLNWYNLPINGDFCNDIVLVSWLYPTKPFVRMYQFDLRLNTIFPVNYIVKSRYPAPYYIYYVESRSVALKEDFKSAYFKIGSNNCLMTTDNDEELV